MILTSPEAITTLVLLACMAGAVGLLVGLTAAYVVHRRTPVPQEEFPPTEDSPEWGEYKTTL